MAAFDKPEETTDAAKLRQLSERIEALQGKKPETGIADGEDPAAAQGSRIGYELLGAVLGCVGIGYLIDSQAGTMPTGTVTGVFVGFVAGIANAWRATNGVERAVGLRRPETDADKMNKTGKTGKNTGQ